MLEGVVGGSSLTASLSIVFQPPDIVGGDADVLLKIGGVMYWDHLPLELTLSAGVNVGKL
jgi:hypothetical protein